MPTIDPEKARHFAEDVVRRLRDAGHAALWAGGCVRDHVLGRVPKDFDVATGATPDEIREIFGQRRTLAIGASYGVITVLGPKRAGQIEVATFRRDAVYSDGRHPNHVTFSTAEEDAQRRDFTINGLFYDPLTDEVIDYVGGREDLKRRIVRAIGNPHQRLDEDKLRMLRAVRFAAVLDFALDEPTRTVIRQKAAEINVVSAERIAVEMRQMLVHPSRVRAVQMLHHSRLLEIILPEAMSLNPDDDDGRPTESADSPWRRALRILERLESPSFPAALAGLFCQIEPTLRSAPRMAEKLGRRWKLANDERAQLTWLLDHLPEVCRAKSLPWPRLQRVLTTGGVEQLLDLGEAVAQVLDGTIDAIDHCRQKLALPPAELNPAPLVSGDDLIAHGIPRGKAYRKLLDAARDAQLEKKITCKDEALVVVDRLWQSMKPS